MPDQSEFDHLVRVLKEHAGIDYADGSYYCLGCLETVGRAMDAETRWAEHVAGLLAEAGVTVAVRFACQTHACGSCGGCKAAKMRDLLTESQDEQIRLRRAVDDLAAALRLTVEYVGQEMLPPIDGWSWFDALSEHAPDQIPDPPDAACGCYTCIGNKPRPAIGLPWLTTGMTTMIVCPECGNKRCPHGTDHRNACTASNEPGQRGSRYGGITTPPGKSAD